MEQLDKCKVRICHSKRYSALEKESFKKKKYWKIYYHGQNSRCTLGTGPAGTEQVNSLLLDIED